MTEGTENTEGGRNNMLRSMFASVSGLRSHQTRMDVIGNNIANVNTVGYRASRVTFQEVFSETLKGAGAPDANTGRGGTNPIQIGLGMSVGAVDTITTRGSLQRTENPTDLSIEGNGFFIVKGAGTDAYRFTRAGNFGIDKLGNLVNATGKNVYGWLDYGGASNADGTYTFDTNKPIEPINIYSDQYNKNKRIIAAQATSKAVFAGNLDATKPVADPATDPPQFTVPVTIYDALGNDYKVNIHFWKSAVNATDPPTTEWTWQIPDGAGYASGASGEIRFDEEGNIEDLAGFEPVIDVTFTPGSDVGADDFTVQIDFTKVSMYAADSSVKPTHIDGYPTGSLVTFNIGSDGMITGIYSNGQQQPLGLLALASFENPAGLMRAGDNEFVPTTNSGDFRGGVKAGSEGVGTINPGTLEMSNVDLAKQFTEMIITQRGFQANSRIMTTADEILQELANMKR